ncbi:MAG: Amidohydrolase domain protein [Edaphobacter sp.]|nr:Amidohydrolase domain protein [Edaphobacter sp.]
MRLMRGCPFGILSLLSLPAVACLAQVTAVRAQRMLDVKTGRYVSNAVVLVEGDKIIASGSGLTIPANAIVLDLGATTILPGLIDAHTHLMARTPSQGSQNKNYILQLATESEAYRALEGAMDARLTLQAGFTSVRDVESEGSGYADVALRSAIDGGLVEGPRMEVATRAIAATGGYFPLHLSADLLNFPRGAQMITGTDEARKAVREQIYYGADLIKVYADFLDVGSPNTANYNHETLTRDEIRTVVEEAHKGGHRVAAHAMTREGIRNAVESGVDSIEHGTQVDQPTLQEMAEKGTYLVPTSAAISSGYEQAKTPEQRAEMEPIMQSLRAEITNARAAHVRIASGFDAAEDDEQGKNANEIAELVKLGLTPAEAIAAATTTASELMGWQTKVGSLEVGKYADIIGVAGDPLQDVSALQHVTFVMKGGHQVHLERTDTP